MSLNYLSDMNTKQVQKLQKTCNFVFLPIGPTEVHSYYLPTRTDVELAMEVSERAAKKLQEKGIDTLIAPPICYSVADGMNTWPGNTTIRPETVTALIEDVCVSLAKWGFKNILVISGHGEPRHIEAVEAGVQNAMKRDSNIQAKTSDWTARDRELAGHVMKSEHPELEIHAGEHEVGIMMIRCPELVDMEALSKMEPNWADSSFWEKVCSHEHIYTMAELGATDGYFGNPRLATADTGDKFFEIISDHVVEEATAMLR